MKVYHEGDKAQALCHDDGPVTVTYGYRDVPFNDGNGVAKNIMAGICDRCGQVIVIPAQSEPAISQARKRVEHSLEVNIPAAYIDILAAGGRTGLRCAAGGGQRGPPLHGRRAAA